MQAQAAGELLDRAKNRVVVARLPRGLCDGGEVRHRVMPCPVAARLDHVKSANLVKESQVAGVAISASVVEVGVVLLLAARADVDLSAGLPALALPFARVLRRPDLIAFADQVPGAAYVL